MSSHKLILGSAQFGMEYGINNHVGKVSQESAFEILRYAWSRGIKYIDTAPVYGDAEHTLGAFANEYPECSFRIITKFSLRDKENPETSVEKSLRRLRTCKIDTVLFHSMSDFTRFQPSLPNFYAKNKGVLFDRLGVSVYTNAEIEALSSYDYVDIIQFPFNALDNLALRKSAIECVQKKNRTFHIRSAFLQGLFFKDSVALPENLQSLQKPLQDLYRIAESHRLTREQLALRYAVHYSGADGCVIGVDSLVQLKRNLESIDGDLDASCIDQIHRIHVEEISLLNPSTWLK